MKKLNLLFISLILIWGCAKKNEPTPEVQDTQSTIKAKVESPVKSVNKSIISKVETENTNLLNMTEVAIEISTPKPKTDPIETPLIEEKVAIPTLPEPQKEIKPSFDFDQVYPDSIWTNYMTKRGDYLSLIAYNEYGNANEWRRIYNWNKKHWEEREIGPNKNNPNFIYPYKELDLKKPAENAIEWAYEFNIYPVIEGESLWSIAKKVYSDELAWVVLFWDNENLINDNDGNLYPGMEIKVRSELWPEFK